MTACTTDCLLVKLNDGMNSKASVACKQKFGSKRFVPIKDIKNFDPQEVLHIINLIKNFI